ncbi:DUF3696 domain-containing protein [Hahella sp. KA22]|uniref:Uncharacterized conserved protein n=1 Tax=Hahella chejuensis (strain KCTC 2396) TaxID=349521 RepID=Q2SQC7_HAHCH|nr:MULTISPECIES: DUF3696 domain-containing protein [Hahella]ABC27147.1 uncharacterized conserved protein [Hahella chejuensis KCTC 2396]AZZ89848.1 DUF3696 domain-containing protein [Hahella sp. KA22]QAY53217.1 DUF3696 domain-containing protein [Hahella sp. KA22]
MHEEKSSGDDDKSLVHSDYQIRWKNYRRFEDTDWITIKPITILIGANNCGKSSILAPLLLLNQTIKSNDTETPLVTRGRLIDAGNYKDFIHHHEENRNLFLGLRFHLHENRKANKPVGSYPPGAIELTFSKGREAHQLILNKYELYDIFKRKYLSQSLNKSGKYSLSGNISYSKMSDREKAAVLKSEVVNFLFSPTSTLYSLELPSDESEESEVERFSEEFSHYLRAIGYAFSEIRSLFQNLSYVGPLRKKIERYYRIASETPQTVGPQGENAPNLFRRNYENLKHDVDRWVKHFEFGDSLHFDDVNDDIFQLFLGSGDQRVNVADVGFGASQVLPLIIQALAAPPDSLTLAEQPEIHLNPRLQCALADLFVHMANNGHRVLVETHSEHLIMRLRKFVANGDIKKDDVALYFLERDGDRSVIKQVNIENNGHINTESWPKGFFDDALREALALASAQAKIRSK